MNRLPLSKRVEIISLLVEGASIRSISRLTGAHLATILKLLVEVGRRCVGLQSRYVRNVPVRYLQLDEIWAFVGCKQGHLPVGDESERGDAYTFVAFDQESRLAVGYLTGKRTWANTVSFVGEVRNRITGQPQITSDGFSPYPDAVERAFGHDCCFAQLVKAYGGPTAAMPLARRYSPPRVVGVERIRIIGSPDDDMICTSHVERQNLTMRMAMRRFTRLTNAFSKKLENLQAAVALHFAFYNFCRIHGSLRVTPAMAAGLTDRVWDIAELVEDRAESEERMAA